MILQSDSAKCTNFPRYCGVFSLGNLSIPYIHHYMSKYTSVDTQEYLEIKNVGRETKREVMQAHSILSWPVASQKKTTRLVRFGQRRMNDCISSIVTQRTY